MKIGKILAIIIGSIFILVIIIGIVRLFMPNTFGTIPFRYGMMGNKNFYQEDLEYKTQSEIQKDAEDTKHDAKIDIQANSITYESNEITIVIIGGPENADEKFVIYELINPTLHVPLDSIITIEFVNADEGMAHDFVITDAKPPYSYMSMMFSGRIYPNSIIGLLPEASGEIFPVAEITFQASQAGEYYYLCLFPGHAAEGMFGKIIIE